MKVEDLIQLLNNRLREFQLSGDYARMSGDLERMNAADKEIISLEDTLYQLNLLVDVSKSATVKEAVLVEVMTDGSVAVLGEYDITSYATDPLHEEKIMNILSNMEVMDTVEKIDSYIRNKYFSSPVTGEMIMSAAAAYEVDARLMMAIMEQDSRFGTAGLAVRTLNPGNVGNDDDGNTRTYESWQEGVTAVAAWLSRHRISGEITTVETFIESIISTSTPSTIIPTATSTPLIFPSLTATSTPPLATSTPSTATSTAEAIPTATSTPSIFPSLTSTSTPPLATSTPSIATSTLGTTVVSNSTTTTPIIATSTTEAVPITNSTTTTTIVTPAPTTATSTDSTTIASTTPPITNSTTTTTVVAPAPTTATSTDSTTIASTTPPITATSTSSVTTTSTTTPVTTTETMPINNSTTITSTPLEINVTEITTTTANTSTTTPVTSTTTAN